MEGDRTMIPTSYLFKGYYQRHWLDAEPESGPTATEPRRFRDGPMRRVADAARQVRPTGRPGLRHPA
jgi:hypothetical protein